MITKYSIVFEQIKLARANVACQLVSPPHHFTKRICDMGWHCSIENRRVWMCNLARCASLCLLPCVTYFHCSFVSIYTLLLAFIR